MINKIHKLKNKYEALLFDFDGTLMNTMPAHNQAWIETFQKINIEISSQELQDMAGIPNQKTAEMLCAKYRIEENPHYISDLKTQRVEELLVHTEPNYEVEQIVRLAQSHFKLGIVSGSHRHLIIPALEKLNMKHFFETIVTCEDTKLGKPNPDPFLLGAKNLNVNPEKCLVFEDGLLGIEAAHKANMSTVFVKNGHIEWD